MILRKGGVTYLVVAVSLASIIFYFTYVVSYESIYPTFLGLNSSSVDKQKTVPSDALASNSHRQRELIAWAPALQCYADTELVNLGPVLHPEEPQNGAAIFFHVTSCPNLTAQSLDADLDLNPRQACAVESAARAHPEKDIFLLFLAPFRIRPNETGNAAVQALLKYPNIHLRHINFLRYIEGTPMASLASLLQKSKWPIPHASDVLRYTTLYKYRGIYLDLDVIVFKKLPLENFTGAESTWSLGAGVISFTNDVVGNDMATACATQLSKAFNGQNWGSNGPAVITQTSLKRCNTKSVQKMWDKNCKGFKVMAPKAFYPIPYQKHWDFFKPGNTENVEKAVNGSYLIHYWNNLSKDHKADSPDVPFCYYAHLHCPKVFDSVSGRF